MKEEQNAKQTMGHESGPQVGQTRRRLIGRLAAFVAAPSLLAAACSTGSSGSSTTSKSAPKALDTNQRDELLWVVWSSDAGARKEAYDLMVKRFNEQYPNVTVTRVAGGAEHLGL